MEEYICKCCGNEWGFIPEDYEFIEEDYPKVCPLCEMPITQMVEEVFKEEGIKEVVRYLIARIKYKIIK